MYIRIKIKSKRRYNCCKFSSFLFTLHCMYIVHMLYITNVERIYFARGDFLWQYKFALHIALFGKNCIKFGANLASKFLKLMQKQHLIIVIFGMNLLSNIITEVEKSTISNARLALFNANKVQIKCTF